MRFDKEYFRLHKYNQVVFSPAERLMSLIDSRNDGVYEKVAIYTIIISIRDILYHGKSTYMNNSKKKAIQWFNHMDDKTPFGFLTICNYFEMDGRRLWLQLRRWLKVNPNYLYSSLKGVESGIFTSPKRTPSLRERKNVDAGEAGKENAPWV